MAAQMYSHKRDWFKVLFPYALGALIIGGYFALISQLQPNPDWQEFENQTRSRSSLEEDLARQLAEDMSSLTDEEAKKLYYDNLSRYEKRLLYRLDLDIRSGRAAPVDIPSPTPPPEVEEPKSGDSINRK